MRKFAAPDFDEALGAFQRGDLERSRAMAEQAISASPSSNWQHLLGLIHCRAGDPQGGVEHLRSAARAEPGNIGFQLMLARALVDSGAADEVLAMPEPPPITTPGAMAQWQVRAQAADCAGDHECGTRAWGRVAAATPGDWRAWSNLGNALAARGQWVEASEALTRALDSGSSEATVRANAVTALLHSGRAHRSQLRFEDSEQAFRRAHAFEPSDPAVVQHLGIALERMNRLDEVADLLDRAAEAGIPDEKLNYLRSIMARREGDLETAHRLLIAADPAEDPVRWNALRAKIADSLGNCAEAFAAAAAMNSAAIDETVSAAGRAKWELQRESYRADLHQLALTITPQWADRVPRLSEPADRKLSFLLGFPRSGTTLLDTFLMGHRKVAVLEEEQLVGRAAQVVGGSADLETASIDRLAKARRTYLDLLADHVEPDFAGLVVDKFPLDMAAAPVIEAMFPSARMIFAQRHPCDVVLSGFMQPIGVVNFSDIEAAADYYDAMMSIWTAARDAMGLNVHVVVYEDLVADPKAVLKPLLNFLDLEWDERLLDHRRTAKERGTIVTPSYDQVTEPITTRASGRWKRYRDQLEPVLPVLLQWATRLGYRD